MNGEESLEVLQKGFDENDRLVAALAKKFGVKTDMNDKQQLAAMGEHMAEQAGQAQPLCMAKRIEELEGLLAEARYMMDNQPRGFSGMIKRIDAALSGKPPRPATQEGWQLVPVDPTIQMLAAFVEAGGKAISGYQAMLAAAPSPKPEVK